MSTEAKVLLVDDHPANLVALSAVIQPLGVKTVEALSGQEALERVARESFAAILLDVQMPEMDGFETARKLRLLPNGRAVPILFITAIYLDATFVKRGYGAGGVDYLTKPFDVDVLRARVKAFVDIYRQREDAQRELRQAAARQLSEAERRLAAFERISSAALETEDVAAFLHTLLEIFLGAADVAETATVFLRHGDELQVHASIGLDEDVARCLSVPVGMGFVGIVASTGRPALIVDQQIRSVMNRPALLARGIRALFAVPLVSDGEVIGVVDIGTSKGGAFSESERRLLTAIADRAAWAVTRRRMRSRLQAVLREAPALVAIWRYPGNTCEFANEAYQQLSGGREMVGMHRKEDVIAGGLDAEFEHAAVHAEAITLKERAIERVWEEGRGGAERLFNIGLYPLRDALGQPEAVISFAVEVTDEVHARRALEKSERERAQLLQRERAAREAAEGANRLKDEFLATVSHELRTPLNAILGWSAAARRSAPPAFARSFAAIERNARAQARMVDDVLDMSRMVSGKLKLEMVHTEVAHTIFSAAETLRPAAEGKGVSLEIRVEDDLGAILADAERIQQVVWNLISNAVKFTPKGGQVRVIAERVASTVVISVADTGRGIAPEFLPLMFEPFRQEDASTTRRAGGLGLGLAIAKQLVQAHGGVIRAESAGPGHGATFTVTLPCCEASPVAGLAAVPQGASKDDEWARLDGVRVLLVEDDADSRFLMAEVLSEQGAVVADASSVREALEALTSFIPDVLVSDIGMPDADGYALIRHVRGLSTERGGTIPAIAMTGYARNDDRQHSARSGFQLHLSKPISPRDLIDAILEVRAREPCASPAVH